MRQFHKVKYNVGDRVYWNDPDNGECSGWCDVIHSVFQGEKGEIVLLSAGDGSIIEAYHSEIRNDTMPKQWSQ